MAVKFERNIVGNIMGTRHDEVMAHYTFTFDFKPYRWSQDMKRGDEFADWVESVVRGEIEAILQKDADKLDVGLGQIIRTANSEVWGVGARDFDPSTGRPFWKEGELMKTWSMSRLYQTAIAELRSQVKNFGDNEVGKIFASTGVQPRAGTKPIFLQMKHIIWRVTTDDLGLLGKTAADFFKKADDRFRENKVQKTLATRAHNKRSDAAKRGWRTRKRNARIEKILGRQTKEARRLMETLMHEYLLEIAGLKKGTNAGAQRKTTRKDSRKSNQRRPRTKAKAPAKKNRVRRNPRPRS